MRDLIIERMYWHIDHEPSPERYQHVSTWLAEKMGGMQKFGKKGLKNFTIVNRSPEMDIAINSLSNADLVEMFEYVIRAWCSRQR